MDQIAKEMGVSKATVSYALSGKKSVSEEIRQKVFDTAEEMGYQPPQVAPELIQGKRWKIVLAIDCDNLSLLSAVYRSEIIRGIKNRFPEEQYEISLSFGQALPLKINGQDVDGVISLIKQNELRNKKDLAHMPVVFIGADTNSQDFFEVDADGVGAGYQAAAWVLSMAPKKIIFVIDNEWPHWTTQYKKGFMMAIEEASDRKVEINEINIDKSSDFLSLLKEKKGFDAIILPSDLHVLQLLHHPEFKDSTFVSMKRFEGYQTGAERSAGSLFPAYTIGEKAAELLTGVINKERISRHSIIISCGFQKVSP
jgi:DNA-binding LacI/PurR family transcriptional regulator